MLVGSNNNNNNNNNNDGSLLSLPTVYNWSLQLVKHVVDAARTNGDGV